MGQGAGYVGMWGLERFSRLYRNLTYYEVVALLQCPAAVGDIIEPRDEQDVYGDPQAKGHLETSPDVLGKHVLRQSDSTGLHTEPHKRAVPRMPHSQRGNHATL